MDLIIPFIISLVLVVGLQNCIAIVVGGEDDDIPAVEIIRTRIQHESNLRLKLLTDYDKKVRPSGNTTDTVSVFVSMRLHHIEGVDEQRQVLKIHSWMGFRWNDVRLKWNSPDYGNITQLHTADDELWLPDITLYNNAEGKDIHNYGSTTIMIQSNGDVLWIPSASFSAQCTMTFDNWPNDAHRCHLIIGSWTQHGWDLDLQLGDAAAGIDRANYVENDQWRLMDVGANRTHTVYACCPEPYISLSFSVHIRRNPSHYVYTLVYPANVLLLSSWFLFLLPDSRFRLIVGLLQILAFCGESVFLWTVIPPTYGAPPVVRLIAYSIGCVFYGLVLCLLLDFIGSRQRTVPNWIRSMINPKLGPVLGVTTSKYFNPVMRRRDLGIDQDNKDLLAADRETNSQGVSQVTADLDAQTAITYPQNEWMVFSEIISRFFLLHYAILTIVIISVSL